MQPLKSKEIANPTNLMSSPLGGHHLFSGGGGCILLGQNIYFNPAGRRADYFKLYYMRI